MMTMLLFLLINVMLLGWAIAIFQAFITPKEKKSKKEIAQEKLFTVFFGWIIMPMFLFKTLKNLIKDAFSNDDDSNEKQGKIE